MNKVVLKTLLFLTIGAYFFSPLKAQNTSFKLSDYKNPIYRYQSLELNFDLNSGFTSHHIRSDAGNFPSAMNSFSLNSGAGATYALYSNSPKKQSEIHASFIAGIGSGKNKNDFGSDGDESDNSSFSHLERFNITALRRFYNPNQYYFEAYGLLNSSFQGNSEEYNTNYTGTTSSQKNTLNSSGTDISGALLFGKGRIEQVQDARLAMYLIDDLYRLNRLKGSVPDEAVSELAQLITKLKYKRFFDNRLRQIAEITAIDSFMQNNNITGIPDAAYFTSLNDNWDFANNPARYSGKRLYTGIEAGIGFVNSENSSKNSDPDYNSYTFSHKNNSSKFYLVAGIDCEKPVSFRWQNSSSLKLGIGVRSQLDNLKQTGDNLGDNETQNFLQAIPSTMLNADYGFGIYPNSRTWLTAKWWLLSGWDRELRGTEKEDKTDNLNKFYTYTGPRVQAYYYISEKLRLSLTFNGEFRFDNYHYTYEVPEGNSEKVSSSWWNHQIYAALTYSLF